MRFEHLIEVNGPAESLQLVAPTFTRLLVDLSTWVRTGRWRDRG